MTTQGHQAAEIWRDAEFAQAWTRADGTGEDRLAYPRAIAAGLVALDRPDVRLVIDVASGPGAFLEYFLDNFPNAKGVWTDASEPMLETARKRLARFGDRVSYVIADMTDLSTVGLPQGADVLLTSRAAHHLDRAALSAFYQQAATYVAPGGWLINLDHIGPSDTWDRRFRAARKAMSTPGPKAPPHHHNYPLTSIQDHIDGFRAAGIDDVEIAWKAFFTCLFVGRTEG